MIPSPKELISYYESQEASLKVIEDLQNRGFRKSFG
jgi:hypothetical protein